MDHAHMDHGNMDHGGMDHGGMDHGGHGGGGMTDMCNMNVSIYPRFPFLSYAPAWLT